MDDRDAFWTAALGALLYGAIFIVTLIVLGVLWRLRMATLFGLLSAGSAYLCFMLQVTCGPEIVWARVVALIMMFASIITAAIGLFLLFLVF